MRLASAWSCQVPLAWLLSAIAACLPHSFDGAAPSDPTKSMGAPFRSPFTVALFLFAL